MPRIAYNSIKMSASTLQVIDHAVAIIDEYAAAGYTLTLRQLYYQFVARGLLRNRQTEYKRLGSIIGDARMCGLIDWDSIEDRGRNLQTWPAWNTPVEIIELVADQFRLNPWESQDFYVEVWVEKEALLSVVGSACAEHRVPYFACKGYSSLSEMWTAGHHRLRRAVQRRKAIRIFHLGDHDPSGIDMTNDIRARLSTFAGVNVDVQRLALNMDQVEEMNPPPNPAKTTDSRYESYRFEYGDESWELDAIDPVALVEIIKSNIAQVVDKGAWKRVLREENVHRATLDAIARNYECVEDFVQEECGD